MFLWADSLAILRPGGRRLQQVHTNGPRRRTCVVSSSVVCEEGSGGGSGAQVGSADEVSQRVQSHYYTRLGGSQSSGPGR